MFRSISWCLAAILVVSALSMGFRLSGAEGKKTGESKAESDWEDVIRRGLDRPVTLEVKEVPLKDVVEQLAKQAGIPNARLDLRALGDVGIGPDTPITRNLKGITLRSTLRLVLKELYLTYVMRDEVLLITTPEEAETQLITQIFDVLDLVRLDDDALPDEYDYGTLIELITSIVAPTTWADAGGAGSIDGYRGTLVLSQTQDVLDEISPLLDAVRKARQMVRESGTQTPPVTSLLAGPPRVQAIDRALSQKGSYDFEETPLHDVVDFLEKTFEVPIEIEIRSLEDVGIGSDTPITFSATDLTLRNALRHVLQELDLTYVQRCSVLLITTPEEAESVLETRIYLAGDLLSGVSAAPAGGCVNFELADYDTLIELTTSTVAPVTWVDVGGYGAIEGMPFGFYVVSQTAEVHQEIQQLFAKLRKTIPREKLAEAEGDEDGLRLVVYFVGSATPAATTPSVTPEGGKAQDDTKTAPNQTGSNPFLHQMGGGGFGGMPSGTFEDGELLELVQELVEPESWDAEGVYALAAAGRLIIRQTDDVHRQIRRVLNRLGVIYYDTAQKPRYFRGGFFGGGMGGMGMGGMGGMGGGGMGGGGGFF